jgi:putative acetyltransferase
MNDEAASGPLQIRQEAETDRDGVRAVHLAAFHGDDEADLVDRLHADGDALFGLVAAEAGRIVGHIFFSPLGIATASGTIPAAALAPLAVLPQRQRRGIGTALVRRGLALCRERGVPAVVVLGDPAFYHRFGFRAETARQLDAPWSGPHLMAIELVPGGLGDVPGMACYAAAFGSLES